MTKLEDLHSDANYQADVYARCKAQSAVAKRAYEDAVHEERVAREQVEAAINKLAAFVASVHKSTAEKGPSDT